MNSPVEQLTEPQRECLRLVLSHHNSKEIAGLLKVSPSAVDKRIERAVQLLGASSRFAAARMLSEHNDGHASTGFPLDATDEEFPDACDRFACEPIDVPSDAFHGPSPPVDGPWWVVHRLTGVLPESRLSGEVRNRLGRRQRLAVILGLALFVAVTTMALLNLASTLSTVVSTARNGSSR